MNDKNSMIINSTTNGKINGIIQLIDTKLQTSKV